jgi:hypothetical protein
VLGQKLEEVTLTLGTKSRGDLLERRPTFNASKYLFHAAA